MIRKWHKRNKNAAFYVPESFFKQLGWKPGETLEIEIDGMNAYIKKTDKCFGMVQSLSNSQKFVSLPIDADDKSLKKSSQVDINIVGDILVAKFL